MGNLELVMVYRAEDQILQVAYQNDTTSRFVIDGEITFNGPDPIPLKGDLAPGTLGLFGNMPLDQINDYPHFEITIERHTNQGHAETFERKIKTKPKHFLKMSVLSKWGNRPGRSYSLWSPGKETSSLADIVGSGITDAPMDNVKTQGGIVRDLSELAMFNRELDLHADKLFDDAGSVSPEIIFDKQMKTFQWFLEKAKSMNLDRVFVIHGVGSGRLKKEIARRLEYDPAVASFTNEHHPRYGFGATEIIFKNE